MNTLSNYKASVNIIVFFFLILRFSFTAWKVSKYWVISGPCFSVFELNTEIYGVNLRIQSKYRKMRTRNNSVFGHFSRSDIFKKLYFTLTLRSIGSRFLLLVSCKNVNNTHAYMTIFILLNRMWIRTCIYLLTNMFIFVHMCVWVMKFLWEDARCIFQKYMLSIDLTD